MPDLQEYSVLVDAAANVNVPTHTISARVIEGQDVLADFTGDNAIHWPSVLSTLTVEQQQQIAQNNANTIIFMKAGI